MIRFKYDFSLFVLFFCCCFFATDLRKQISDEDQCRAVCCIADGVLYISLTHLHSQKSKMMSLISWIHAVQSAVHH